MVMPLHRCGLYCGGGRMTDYTKLTEQEINKLVFELKFEELPYVNKQGVVKHKDKFGCVYAPCTRSNQWARLLEELRELGTIYIDDKAACLIPKPLDNPIAVQNEPKLGKAICILWLMVKGK